MSHLTKLEESKISSPLELKTHSVEVFPLQTEGIYMHSRKISQKISLLRKPVPEKEHTSIQ